MKRYLVPALILLTACTASQDDLQQWVAQTKKSALSKAIPAETQPIMTNPSYQAPTSHGLNAFDSRRLTTADRSRNAPDTQRKKEVLEQFELNTLKYVGSLRNGNNLSGYIEANGHVYTVKIGNYIGQNYGRIQKITPEKIILIETIEDSTDGWIFRQTELPIASDNGNSQTPSDKQ